MAYIQAQSSRRRTTTIAGVAALHAAAIYGLVTGFAAEVWDTVDYYMPTADYPNEPPPPQPTAEPSAKSPESKVTAPKPPVSFDNVVGPTVIDLPHQLPLPIPTANPGLSDAIELPSPTPTASFAPRGPVPLGSPGKWATSADYPAAELRQEREGTARFRVTVGADGRVNNCEILVSSGSPGLDRATCEQVSQRARFRPATDTAGATVAGSYTNAIRWEIPD